MDPRREVERVKNIVAIADQCLLVLADRANRSYISAKVLADFRKSAGWKAGVDGSVALATLGAGGEISTDTIEEPIIGFIFSNKGLMYNLIFEGSKITRLER